MKKDCLAREMTMEMIVGAFMVMVFLGLGYFTIILSRETWFGTRVPMEVVFDNVMGLREGDNVVVRGMPVGTVDRLHLASDGVHVVLTLEEALKMYEDDYKITIEATSMLGGRHMAIETGSAGRILSRDEVYRGDEPYDLIEDAAALVNAARAGVVEGGMIENFRIASEELRKVAMRLGGGEGTLGKLLSEDTEVYDDFADTVASLKAIAERLEKGEGALGQLLAADDTVYEDIAASAASLRAVSEKLERGEGSMGRLLTDEGLYTGVEDLIEEVRATIDDMRETSPVVTFTSVFFGAF